MKTICYMNLTNGIEYLQGLADIALVIFPKISFIRIQSTYAEQKLWSEIIEDLDYDFLLNLAVGNKCIVYDYSAHKENSRALYQAIPWIKYCLDRIWFKVEHKAFVKGIDTTKYFNEEFRKLSSKAEKKLKYFRKFLLTDEIFLQTVCKKTTIDSKYDIYKQILKNYNEND